ncbi:hypothetical protein GPECTOR_11g270 [Gonium pectorale]|uniref:Peptide-methionine (S)-S-oxide reductase n=1 Tax=Gonium pectorale TaxID=33097 RepID=A0A150GPU8_GONPE|nr:hypothetical protein GPECTOR_11g270 [Gonium pectorale]|eukprot:KXZ51831.1 hypothetical protein GPECTOR_11g270 [Gonium pectorale]
MRADPQDVGPAYRNVIGIPGGINSPMFRIIQEENKYGMELREGRGNVVERGRATEASAVLPLRDNPPAQSKDSGVDSGDVLNTVWVVDSDALPFYRAERYHQFHNGLGKIFPLEYVRDLRNQIAGLGRIEPTGCLELPF